MEPNERWDYLIALDDELLKGGVILPEWCSFIVQQADIAFVNGAHLASILTAVAAIETYLRAEHSVNGTERLVDLIDRVPGTSRLRSDLHSLRKYRNSWVHVDDPLNDRSIIENPAVYEVELDKMAMHSAKLLREVIYKAAWI
ncbi:hypothetical protein [Janthinobacterium sp. PSPC2-1]|uniref:hypothetical protein n=1 Tax=unclassified Janthinobacterium TaxID=2610881 RepID=UPI003CF5F3F2